MDLDSEMKFDLAGGHTIGNHISVGAKSARWSVNCSCGWTRNRFNTCASANAAGIEHQSLAKNQTTEQLQIAS